MQVRDLTTLKKQFLLLPMPRYSVCEPAFLPVHVCMCVSVCVCALLCCVNLGGCCLSEPSCGFDVEFDD